MAEYAPLQNGTGEPNNTPDNPAKRPGAVTGAGLLLLIQAAILCAIGSAHLAAIYHPEIAILSTWFPGETRRIVLGAVLIPLSVLMALAAIGLFRLGRYSWLLAIFCQGASLLVALLLYFNNKPWFAYLLMVNGIGMVLYLNYHDTQAPFQPTSETCDKRGHGPAQ
ncbi:MAG: hypothetical protein JXA42_17010 [Anaerolineales bacterium]|nr:hypothetical protein [Anaerolineales bacterium]